MHLAIAWALPNHWCWLYLICLVAAAARHCQKMEKQRKQCRMFRPSLGHRRHSRFLRDWAHILVVSALFLALPILVPLFAFWLYLAYFLWMQNINGGCLERFFYLS